MAKRKNPHAAALGRLGGIAASRKLTKKQRTERARAAVMARWAQYRKES